MATVYSLICWGGLNGKSVSGATSTDILTLTNHGLRVGTKVVAQSTVSGVVAGTTYYAYPITASTFYLYDTLANAQAGGTTGRIDITATTAFVLKSDLVANPATALSTYGLSDLSRWGTSGSERIYDGLTSWVAGRSGAGRTDIEVAEIGEAFTDIISSQIDLNIPSAGNQIVTKINGRRTAGFHAGNFPKSTLVAQELKHGYILFTQDSPYRMIYMSRYRDFIDGAVVMTTNGSLSGAIDLGVQCRAINNIFYNTTTSGSGIVFRGALSEAVNNTLVGWYRPFDVFSNQAGIRLLNNLATKNYSALPTDSAIRGFYYNNIIIGNSFSDWSTQPTSMEHASNNYGPAGTAWMATGAVRYTIATTDFMDWANNDFRPASATSPQVDTGIYPYDGLTYDIAGNVRPSYKGGAATEIDGGPYEFDHGYGPWPSSDSRGLAFTGLLAGSKVKVFLTGTDTEKFSTASSGTSETWSENVSGSLTVDYVILKAGYLPIRVTGITVTAGPSGVQSTPVSQIVARWYQTASGLTLNTDTFANASTKNFGITVASTVQNLASYLFDQWIALGDTGEAYANKPFPIEANGPNSFTWLDGWEADLSTYPNTISLLSRDGMRYLSTSGVMTASWCALLSAGVPSGIQVRYQQLEGNTPTGAINTGNIDQLIQIYGDATHGSFDYRSYMVAKVQAEGYDQAEVDVVGQYGTLEDQLYVIALYPQSNNVAAGNPTVTTVSITDHGASPVTWNGQQFSCTITDSGTTTGLEIMQWIRHAFAVGGLFQGKDGFNWHDLVQKNGTKYKGVRGSIYGDTGATLKGVRVLRGSDPHPDFTIHTADNGSVVDTTPPEAAVGTVSDIVAGSRLQVYNVTTATEMYNAVVAGTSYSTSYTNGTGYTAGDVVRVRLTYCSGLTAKLPAEYFTIAASGGWSVLANQEADTVYIDNGIDGSTVTEYNSDYVNVQIDISDPDNTTTIQRGYAWYCYQMTLIDGIRYFFDAFIAEDAFNYLLNTDVADIKIQNTGATGVTLTGGALRRKDGSSPIASGGSVYIYYGRAYSDVVTIAGSSVVTGDLADIAPAVWSHGTRTLTSGGGGGASADDVWNHSKALSVGKFLGLK